MGDKQILFSAPMIRALLREVEAPGTGKTQTRRILTPQNFTLLGHDFKFHRPDAEILASALYGARDFRWIEGAFSWLAEPGGINSMAVAVQGRGKPIYAPGDRLWVREAWCADGATDGQTALYRATELGAVILDDGDGFAVTNQDGSLRSPWRPSIHMPRWASRLTLYVTEVRVERLNSISEADALAEGVVNNGRMDGESWAHCYVPGVTKGYEADPVACYSSLWEDINGAGAWAQNPWVIAISFIPKMGNIDAI